jgi:hypothetical protein
VTTVHAIDLDGRSVMLRDFGGKGIAVVLVHALGASGVVWEPLAASLSASAHP